MENKRLMAASWAKKSRATAKDFLNSKDIVFEDIFNYVATNKKIKLDLFEFYIIHNAFREKWNQSVGKIMGDGDYKNFVYRYIETEYEKQKNEDYPPQENVDACVDLILEYMELGGHWYSDSSSNEIVGKLEWKILSIIKKIKKWLQS